jgi:cell division septation protein DedD
MTQAANRLFFLLSLILILVIGGPVWAQSTEADIRYDQGLLAYRTGDVERARDIWLPLAEGGHPIAQYSLGKLYDIGGGAIKPSGSQAALWYRQAAVQGVAAAQNNLALMYAQGLADVPRDPAKAAKLWHEAAEAGHPVAQYNIGLAFFNGDGVGMDRRQAVDWFRSAGDAGVADAQFVLGQLFRQGMVVAQDDSQAMRWYQMAAAQGHQGARDQMSRVQRAMGAQPSSETMVASNSPAMAQPMHEPMDEPIGMAPGNDAPSSDQMAALPPAETKAAEPMKKQPMSTGFRVWLASASKKSEAESIWQKVSESHAQVFEGVKGKVAKVDLGDAGAVYRVTAGPFSERDAARELCDRLRGKEPGAFCKVQKN